MGGNQARFRQSTQSRRTLTLSLTVTRSHKIHVVAIRGRLQIQEEITKKTEGRYNLCFLLFKTLPGNREWTPMHANAA